MAFAADRAKVNKDIFTAIPCNKAESLGGVEPLYLSLLALALFRGLSAGSDAAAAGFLGASIGFNGSARACEKCREECYGCHQEQADGKVVRS